METLNYEYERRMKEMMKRLLPFLILSVLCFSGCTNGESTSSENTETVTTSQESVTEPAKTIAPVTSSAPVTTVTYKMKPRELTLENFPLIDGWDTTSDLDAHIRAAILGISFEEARNSVNHSILFQVWFRESFFKEKSHAYLTSPYSVNLFTKVNYTLKETPVCRKGLLFVVNPDNPVDSLTSEEIRKIYSGEITNWKDVGGNDAEIRVFQKITSSEGYNYMKEYMGEYEFCTPVMDYTGDSFQAFGKEYARYDNDIDSIGYMIYTSDSDPRLKNFKVIAVDSVFPSWETLNDGTYPAFSYLYLMYRSDDSLVKKNLAEFIQSEEGQDAVERAGMIRTDGKKKDFSINRKIPYSQTGTGKPVPENYNLPKGYYYNDDIEKITDVQAYDMVSDFLKQSGDKLNDMTANIPESELPMTEDSCIDKEKFSISNSVSCINQYCFAFSGLYYNGELIDVKTAYFDLAEHKQMNFSDLYYEGVNFMGYINDEAYRYIAKYGNSMQVCYYSDPDSFPGFYEDCFFALPSGIGMNLYLPYRNPYCDRRSVELLLSNDFLYEIADKSVIYEEFDASNLYREAEYIDCDYNFYFGTKSTSVSFVEYPVKSRTVNYSQLRTLQKTVLECAEKIIAEENPAFQNKFKDGEYDPGYACYFGIRLSFQPDKNRFVFKPAHIMDYAYFEYYLDIDTLEFYTE